MKPTPGLPHVLVLLATFDGAEWLDEQLQSIFEQEQVRVSLVASDDGSKDHTRDVLARWAQAQPGMRVLQPVSGLGAAGNFLRLLREASLQGVDYVALADQDDIWLAGRLGRAIERLSGESASGYSSDAIAFWPDGRRRPLGKADPQRALDYLFEPAGPGCTYVLGADLAAAAQAEFCRQPQRFVGIGYHDWLIYAYARTHGYRWTIDRKPGVLYRQHDRNELGANFGVGGVHRRWGRLTSGWFRRQVLQIASLWPSPHEQHILRLSRLGSFDRLWLAAHVRNLRRRSRDQLALAAMLLIGVFR